MPDNNLSYLWIDTEFGDTLINLKEVEFISIGYKNEQHPLSFFMKSGNKYESCLNTEGYKYLKTILYNIK